MAAKSRLLRRKRAEWQAEKRDRAVARRKPQKKRAEAAEEELSIARSTIEALELRKADLMEEMGVKAVEHKKELDRLRDSRVYEVTKERVKVETEMIAKSNKHFGNLATGGLATRLSTQRGCCRVRHLEQRNALRL